MAKQRDSLILQSKCDFSTPFATHFFESSKTLDTARVAGCCEWGTSALQPYPFFLQQNRTAKNRRFHLFGVSSQICPIKPFRLLWSGLTRFSIEKALQGFYWGHKSLFFVFIACGCHRFFFSSF